MKYLRRTWAEIDVDALIHNFNTIKNFVNCDIAAVVKADAYGHGASVVAPILSKAGADMFAVSNIEEALELRRAKIKKPILILGYTPVEYAPVLAKKGIIQTVHSLSYAKELSNAATSKKCVVSCHIKVDTGMTRLGFNCRDDELVDKNDLIECTSLKGLSFNGIFTHFATADRDNDPNSEHTNAQFCRFISICDFLLENGINFKYKHCCNSAGLMLHSDKHLQLTRPGIILYGLTPSANLQPPLSLLPVMSFKTTIAFVKKIKAGDNISYGKNFTATKDMTVATIPVGYADGYPRALSNKAHVLVNGQRARILGNICMDQMIIDVTDIENVAEGDEVTLFGKDLPVEELATICNTINYELICGVSRRVPRVYIKNGKEIKVVDYIMDK